MPTITAAPADFPEPINTSDGKPAISARAFYLDVLEHAPQNFNRWLKRNVLDCTYLHEGRDYEVFFQPEENPQKGGRPAQDAALSLRCAQHLCLTSDTERGHAYREHLLDLEEREMQAALEQQREQVMREELRQLILREVPKPWQPFFDADWWIEHRRVFGKELFGTFWIEAFYHRLPDGVQVLEEIRERNPHDPETGHRARKHHVFISDKAESMAREQANRTLGILIATPTGRPDLFWERLDDRYPINGGQLELRHVPANRRLYNRDSPRQIYLDYGEAS